MDFVLIVYLLSAVLQCVLVSYYGCTCPVVFQISSELCSVFFSGKVLLHHTACDRDVIIGQIVVVVDQFSGIRIFLNRLGQGIQCGAVNVRICGNQCTFLSQESITFGIIYQPV